MAKRDAAKEHFWRRAVARQRASGLGVRAFCERERLSEASYYQWRQELARRDGQGRPTARPGMAFVPVRVVDDQEQPPGGPVEVVLANGRIARVRAGFDRPTLVAVLAVLEAPSC